MAQPRAERLMNLHILLLGAKRFIGKDAIRDAVYPEHARGPAGDEAFERAFERDKDALRQIGAVIEVGSADAFFDDEIGYRIPTEQTSLPEIRFESDEAAVLGLAAKVWQQATLAKATARALAKLKGQGVEIDPARLGVVAPAITADEPAFEPLWDAVGKRRQVSFPYQRASESEPTTRRVQPWGLARSSGRWYVVGFDVDRGAERVFRLSRIVGPVRASGKSGAYDVPAGTDVRAVARRLSPSFPSVRAELRVRQGTGVGAAPTRGVGRAARRARLGRASWSQGPVARALRRGADLRHRRRRRGARRRCATRWSRGCVPWPASAPTARRAPDDDAARRHRTRPGRPPPGAGALPPRPRRGAPRRRGRPLRHRRRPDRARPAAALHDRRLARAARAT